MRSIEWPYSSIILSDQYPQPHNFSERKLTFTFALLSPVRLSAVCLSACLKRSRTLYSVSRVHERQEVEIFGNISAAFGTLAIIR